MTRETPTRGTGFLAAIASDARAPVRLGWMSLTGPTTDALRPKQTDGGEARAAAIKTATPVFEPPIAGESFEAGTTHSKPAGVASPQAGAEPESAQRIRAAPGPNVDDESAVRRHSDSIETATAHHNATVNDGTPIRGGDVEQADVGVQNEQTSAWRLRAVDKKIEHKDVESAAGHRKAETSGFSDGHPASTRHETDQAGSGNTRLVEANSDEVSNQAGVKRTPSIAPPAADAVFKNESEREVNLQPASDQRAAHPPGGERPALSGKVMRDRTVEVRHPAIGKMPSDNERSGGEVHIGRVDITVVSSDPVPATRPAKTAKPHKAPAIRPESLHYVRRF